jgi:hypothetical protein
MLKFQQFNITKIFTKIWAHFRRKAPETGLCGVPLRSILCAWQHKERFAPLQSLARLQTGAFSARGIILGRKIDAATAIPEGIQSPYRSAV